MVFVAAHPEIAVPAQVAHWEASALTKVFGARGPWPFVSKFSNLILASSFAVGNSFFRRRPDARRERLSRRLVDEDAIEEIPRLPLRKKRVAED